MVTADADLISFVTSLTTVQLQQPILLNTTNQLLSVVTCHL